LVHPVQDALRLLQSGRFAEAEAGCRRYLSRDPGNADALHIRGLALAELGRQTEAIENLERASRQAPREASIHENLGRVRLAGGNAASAAVAFGDALAIDPNRPASRLGLGLSLAHQARTNEAIEQFRRALSLAPGWLEAKLNLAIALRQLGSLVEAEQLHQEMTSAKDSPREVWLGLALIQRQRELYPDAIATYRRAGERFPQLAVDPAFQVALADALRANGDVAEALALLEPLVAARPQAGVGRIALARALIADRRFADAADRLAPLLEARNVEAALVFAQVAVALDDRARAIAVLEEIRDKSDTPSEDRRAVLFELAKLYDAEGRIDEAFVALRAGHALRSQAVPVTAHRGTTERLIRAFAEARFANFPRSSNDSDVPVFIVGMPRSGTTLVEQILAGHRDVAVAGELTVFDDLAQGLPARLGSSQAYPECVVGLSATALDALSREYVFQLERFGPGKRRIVDKLPHNFQNVGLLALALPRSKIVHCSRNPLDTCVSIYFQDFGDRQAYARDLREIGMHYAEYRNLMAHWAALGIKMLEVRYEELVGDVTAGAQRLVEFLGLDWDPNCLNFHENRRAVQTVSAAQVRRPIYRSAVGRWQRYTQHLGDLKDALQSPEETGKLTVLPTRHSGGN